MAELFTRFARKIWCRTDDQISSIQYSPNVDLAKGSYHHMIELIRESEFGLRCCMNTSLNLGAGDVSAVYYIIIIIIIVVILIIIIIILLLLLYYYYYY